MLIQAVFTPTEFLFDGVLEDIIILNEMSAVTNGVIKMIGKGIELNILPTDTGVH